MLADLYGTGLIGETVCRAVRKGICDEQWWFLAMHGVSQMTSGSPTAILIPPFLHPGDIWQCLETFTVVTPGGQGEGRVLFNILRCVGQPPSQRINKPQMSTMLRLNTFSLDLSWNSVPWHQNSCSYTASDLTNCCSKNKNAFQHSIVHCRFVTIKYLVTTQKIKHLLPRVDSMDNFKIKQTTKSSNFIKRF